MDEDGKRRAVEEPGKLIFPELSQFASRVTTVAE
jgi:hypothetical protein